MTDAATAGPGALDGVRVLDLTWVIAGPVSTQILADYGAEVIKMESDRSMDPGRMGGPWLDGVNTAPDGGGGFTRLNRNKLSATLNLKDPRGVELFKKLVAVSDVIVNNYSAGTMERFGVGYETLRAINPRLIMAEMSGMGQTGPYRGHAAYGQTLMATGGLYELTGYPDGSPQLPGYTYADFASPTIGAFAIMAALIWRQTSGKGQYIDLAQFQVTASLAAEPQFEALVNGTDQTRQGNAEPGTIVHECFKSAGDDEWCVIVVRNAREWASLRQAVGDGLPEQPSMPASPEALAVIAAWTGQRSSREVMETLQGLGVEAGRVQDIRMLVDDDEHIRDRGYYTTYDHLIGKKAFVDGPAFKMSATPGSVRRPGPVYGVDNEYVFGELVGLDLAEIHSLREAGVIA
jgi:benzylsuccinate CoA-transferase BbsF subunit